VKHEGIGVRRLFRSKKVWIAIGFVLVGGWILMRYATPPPPVPGPEEVSVDASHLPASVTVHGVKITLEWAMRCAPDQVMLTITARAPKGRTLLRAEDHASAAGYDLARESWGGTSPDQALVSNYSYTYKLEKPAKKLDMGFGLQSYISPGSTKLSFRNIPVSSLPVTRSAGPVSVTLDKVSYGQTPKGFVPFTFRGQDRSFVLVYYEQGPPDNFRGSYKLLRDGYERSCESPAPYWRISNTGFLTTDSGMTIHSDGATGHEYGGATEVFMNETEKLTRRETIVKFFSKKAAANMVTNRALARALAEPRKFKSALFFDKKITPKTITWEPTVPLPPKDRKDIRVVFKNVPVPAK
jgi:hypothetical protein